MIKITILYFFLVLSSSTRGQHAAKQIDLIQGIWAGTMTSETEFMLKIVKGNRSLGISYKTNSSNLDFYLNESIEGFQDYEYDQVDSINTNWFKDDGRYYTIIVNEDKISDNGWVSTIYCIIPEYFNCDRERLSVNGGKLIEYIKLDEVPFEAITRLYKRGKADRRDYNSEYLGITVTAIVSPATRVYNQPRRQVISSLRKNDVVVMLDKNGKWIKIKYGEQDIGWIKTEDTLYTGKKYIPGTGQMEDK